MFPGLIDLASSLMGGLVVEASDEFFAPKENLLKPEPPVFIPGKYTDAGKWMDGWESRRKRTPGNDWCVIRLGAPGILRTIDVDTSHFLGNYPAHCSLDAADVQYEPTNADWTAVLERVRLQGGGHNLFDILDGRRFTHVRLNIFPDGGVARLRVYGEASPDLEKLKAAGDPVDLALAIHGGRVLASSDSFFGHENNLILPGSPADMGGGWETRRRRGPGYDWIIVQLGARTSIERIAVETEHYKGNYPDRCSIDACDAAAPLTEHLITGRVSWSELLPSSKLQADSAHLFDAQLQPPRVATHVRLNIYPDGGISRLRVFGKIVQ